VKVEDLMIIETHILLYHYALEKMSIEYGDKGYLIVVAICFLLLISFDGL
jgi:hypothetical protein